MNHSTIRVYKTTLTPDRNALVDDLEGYLASCSAQWGSDNFQYQKLGLDISVKIALPEEFIATQNLGNYVRIEQNGKAWYYFVLEARWISQGAVELVLSIDSINTFRNDVVWSDKTQIMRQHGDRLVKIGVGGDTQGYLRIIDRENENIVSNKLKSSDEQILNDVNRDFFLIYRTREDLRPDNTANPIECCLVADQPLLYKTGVNAPSPRTLLPADLINGRYYFIDSRNNPTFKFKVNGFLYADHKPSDAPISFMFYRDGQKIRVFRNNYFTDGNVIYWHETIELFAQGCDAVEFETLKLFTIGTEKYRAFNDIANLSQTLLFETGITDNVYIRSIDEIDKTDSRIMKIIRLPYAPFKIIQKDNGEYIIPEQWEYQNGLLKLKDNDLSKEFLHETIASVDVPELKIRTPLGVGNPVVPKDIWNESKLYHSDFYTFKVLYDNFAKEIKLENVKLATEPGIEEVESNYVPSFTIDFKPTNTINSKMAFKFIWTPADTYDIPIVPEEESDNDYNDFLLATRNNEETIFSNDYINYIRNGYNYDKKAQSLSMAQSWVSTGLDFAGGVGSALAIGKAEGFSGLGGVGIVSTVGKAIGSVADNLFSQAQADNQMNSRLQQLSNQASRVSGTDDIDLLKFYNGNRLHTVKYISEDHEREALWDLFFYCGYSHKRQEMPNTTSRYWFNFIQCNPVFANEGTSPFTIYMNDMKARYAKGVTVYHSHPGVLTDTNYDWEQSRENWETSIL